MCSPCYYEHVFVSRSYEHRLDRSLARDRELQHRRAQSRARRGRAAGVEDQAASQSPDLGHVGVSEDDGVATCESLRQAQRTSERRARIVQEAYLDLADLDDAPRRQPELERRVVEIG